MTWEDMCKGALTEGEYVEAKYLYGPQADEVRLRRAGLPDKTDLGLYAARAQSLRIETPNAGIYFNIIQATIKKGVVQTTKELCKRWVDRKRGSRGCFEDEVLPEREGIPNHGVNILIHQSLIPCKRCRTGYKKWAEQNACTIVVYGDGAYDGIGPNIVFIFSLSGKVYYA